MDGTKVRQVAVATAAALLLAGLSMGPSYCFSGDLFSNTLPPGILGTGIWIDPGVSHLHWDVTQGIGGIWDYSYTFTVPRGEISHLILEVSPNFSESDISSISGTFEDIEIKTYSPADPGNSNPNLPGPIYGIKFDEVETTTGTFTIQTLRNPVWGDFYARNGTAGNDQGVFNTAWNAGFLTADPSDPPSDGSIGFHLLVPDTNAPIPDASTLLLTCTGALSLIAIRRRILG